MLYITPVARQVLEVEKVFTTRGFIPGKLLLLPKFFGWSGYGHDLQDESGTFIGSVIFVPNVKVDQLTTGRV